MEGSFVNKYALASLIKLQLQFVCNNSSFTLSCRRLKSKFQDPPFSKWFA